MEYFRIVKSETNEQSLQHYLTLKNLNRISSEIFNLDEPSEKESNIGGIWGEFTLHRDNINGGVRFSLIECPNALCWSITTGYPPEPHSIIIHLTINRQNVNEEFNGEIVAFLDDLCSNLSNYLNRED